jgi:transcriptional antiterminator Rof (Rho-off)
MTSDYRPIDCDLHSVLELLAMRRTRGVVCVIGPGGAKAPTEGTIVDVTTLAGAEYLDVVDARGVAHRFRLDRIGRILGLDGRTLWSAASDAEGGRGRR